MTIDTRTELTATEAEATAAETAVDAPTDTDGEHDYKAGEAKWKAMSRKH